MISQSDAALGYSYAYTGGGTPGYTTGAPNYSDNLHSGTTGINGTIPTVYDSTGDLNDGTLVTSGAPTDAYPGVVSWGYENSTDIAQITCDLGGLYDVTEVRMDSYIYLAFKNGTPDDVDISFSTDGSSYSTPTNYLTDFGGITTDGNQVETITLSATGVQFVRLHFDGGWNNNTANINKWTLSELTIEGVAVPEPSHAAFLGLAGLGLMLRRRR